MTQITIKQPDFMKKNNKLYNRGFIIVGYNMQINFTQIFQDSLNFMRNQRKTVLIFIGIFVVTQLINQLVSVPLPSLGDNPNPSLQDIIDALSKVEPTALIGSFVFQQLLMSFIATFGIATIHHISLQNENPINQGSC